MAILINIIAVLYLLFLPGFFLSLVFFRWGMISLIERLAYSFALSIAVVPLVVFYSNLIGIPITMMTVILHSLGIIIIAGLLIALQRRKQST